MQVRSCEAPCSALVSVVLTPLTNDIAHAGMLRLVLSNAMCSKKARQALSDKLILVGDSPSCNSAAARVAEACEHVYDEHSPASAFSATPKHFKDEYFSIFQPLGYDIAGLELKPRTAAMLLSLLQLKPSDHFVDLGSAGGRLVLTAALLSPVGRATGVELSPSRVEDARRALGRLASVNGPAWAQSMQLTERVSLVQGDLFEANLDGATVVWCAIRPVSGRRLATRLLSQLRRTIPPGGSMRVLLPAFLLPSDEPGVTLRGGYVFSDGPGDTQAAQLYGDGKLGGPRVVLDYLLKYI